MSWVNVGFALFNMAAAIGITVVAVTGVRGPLEPEHPRMVAILFTIAAVIACFGATRSWWLTALVTGVLAILYMVQYEQLRRDREPS